MSSCYKLISRSVGLRLGSWPILGVFYIQIFFNYDQFVLRVVLVYFLVTVLFHSTYTPITITLHLKLRTGGLVSAAVELSYIM